VTAATRLAAAVPAAAAAAAKAAQLAKAAQAAAQAVLLVAGLRPHVTMRMISQPAILT
jgi:hypothetical protein